MGIHASWFNYLSIYIYIYILIKQYSTILFNMVKELNLEGVKHYVKDL
jgi:hypothetical protein